MNNIAPIETKTDNTRTRTKSTSQSKQAEEITKLNLDVSNWNYSPFSAIEEAEQGEGSFIDKASYDPSIELHKSCAPNSVEVLIFDEEE